LDRFSLVEVLCSKMSPARLSVHFMRQTHSTWADTDAEFSHVMQLVEEVRAPLKAIPKQLQFFDRSV
jgi:hypothetical protein